MRHDTRRRGAALGAALLLAAGTAGAQTPLQNMQAAQQQHLLNQSAAGLAAEGRPRVAWCRPCRTCWARTR